MPVTLFDPTLVKPGESCSGIIHVCDVCGGRGRWTDEWSWYGSLFDQDAGIILKTCGCARPPEGEAAVLLAAKRKRLGHPPKVRRYGYHVC